MTNHYIIHILKSNICLKVTYKNGRWYQVRKHSGRLDIATVSSLGKLFPFLEKSIVDYRQMYADRVTYTLETKDKTIYSQFSQEWFVFYEQFMGVPPKFTGADGSALKGILSYFKSLSKTETEALALWKILLSKWGQLDEFHQKNTDLKYINSRLNVLLSAIKKGETNTTTANYNVQL